jgi:nucleoside-diphosphate-sugar epimerase
MAAIAKDSIVLVTGCNGFIGSHIVDQLLKAGYNVRGTTRDLKKVENLAKIWKEKYGSQNFEVLVVPEMAEDGAFDEAVKG